MQTKTKTKKELTKDERKKKEIVRLKRLFKDISKEKIDTVNSLIENAAFMTIQLEDLQKVITENGVISEYQNGANQWGTKKSPEIEVYNVMIKNQMSIIKQLTDLLPKEIQKEVDDGFNNFIIGRDA